MEQNKDKLRAWIELEKKFNKGLVVEKNIGMMAAFELEKQSKRELLIEFMKWYNYNFPLGTTKKNKEIVNDFFNNKKK